MALTMAIALPVGIGAAIYLEEYTRRNWFARLLQLNISNLAGVPSIVYGLLGLELFVRAMELNRSILSGALTMALVILPIIIVSARRRSRRCRPPAGGGVRAGRVALADGAPDRAAQRLRRLMTGNILAMSRAIGETAPLIMIGALTFIAFLRKSPPTPSPSCPSRSSTGSPAADGVP